MKGCDILEKKKCDIQSHNISPIRCCFPFHNALFNNFEHICQVRKILCCFSVNNICQKMIFAGKKHRWANTDEKKKQINKNWWAKNVEMSKRVMSTFFTSDEHTFTQMSNSNYCENVLIMIFHENAFPWLCRPIRWNSISRATMACNEQLRHSGLKNDFQIVPNMSQTFLTWWI